MIEALLIGAGFLAGHRLGQWHMRKRAHKALDEFGESAKRLIDAAYQQGLRDAPSQHVSAQRELGRHRLQ